MHKNIKIFIQSLILATILAFSTAAFTDPTNNTETKASPYPVMKWYVDQNHILFQDFIRHIPQKTYLSVNIRASCESDHNVLFIDGLTHTSTKLEPCSIFNYTTPVCNNAKGCMNRVIVILENCRMGNCQASGTLSYDILPYTD